MSTGQAVLGSVTYGSTCTAAQQTMLEQGAQYGRIAAVTPRPRGLSYERRE